MKNFWFFPWLVVWSHPASSLFPSLDLTAFCLLSFEECGQKALPLGNAKFLFRPSKILQELVISGTEKGSKRGGVICPGRGLNQDRPIIPLTTILLKHLPAPNKPGLRSLSKN